MCNKEGAIISGCICFWLVAIASSIMLGLSFDTVTFVHYNTKSLILKVELNSYGIIFDNNT